MKFCPECGSEVNEKELCSSCGFNNKLGKFIQKKEIQNPQVNVIIPNNPLGIEDELETTNITRVLYVRNNFKTGEVNLITLDFKDKTLTYVTKEATNSNQITKTYQLNEQFMEELDRIITKHKIKEWSILEKDYSYMDKDLPFENLYIYYGDKHYPISYYAVMKEEQKRILIYIRTLLEKQINQSILINEKEETDTELKFKKMIEI